MARRSRIRVLQPTPRNLAMLAGKIRRGELVAVPTETVYGLAGNALSAATCRRIFSAKGRPATDPLIVHLLSAQQLPEVAISNPVAEKLARAFWPGPLTLVLPKQEIVPDVVTAGRDSVAVRVPAHPAFRRLLRIAAVPVAAPSANPFGYVSPTNAQHVIDGLGDRISYVLDGGTSRHGLESTIVDVRDPDHPRLLRPGAISRAEIEAVLGRRIELGHRQTKRGAQVAPGMLSRHYSPRTPVKIHEQLSLAAARANPAEAFVFQAKPAGRTPENVFWFDARGDLRGVARRLFATLRTLDKAGFRRLHVERAHGAGLAEAINDRLHRAAAQ